MHERPWLPIITAATLLSIIVIIFITSSLVMLVKRQNLKSRKLMQALLDEKENTMRSISMEIHDNIYQMLNVAAIQLHLIEERITPDILPMIRDARKIIDTLSFDTQNISHILNPDYVKNIGLITSLMEITDWLNASGKIRCNIAIEGERKSLPEQTELMAFRIAQEALNNIIKYAHADTISVNLHFRNRDFLMHIVDNGIGMDIHSEVYKKGLGMSNLQQRAKIVNGKLDIFSTPGAGTSVMLTIPIVFTS